MSTDSPLNTTAVVRFPRAKEHRWRRDGIIPIDDIDRLIWTVCPYLRDQKPCEGCPAQEEDKHYGSFVRGCRLMAQEVINICQTGYPHRKTS